MPATGDYGGPHSRLPLGIETGEHDDWPFKTLGRVIRHQVDGIVPLRRKANVELIAC